MAEDKGSPKGLTGLLGGVTDLIEKLEKLAENGGEIARSGSFPSSDSSSEEEEKGSRRPAKGVYGFSVKFGLGDKDKDYKVEPFGNVRRDRTSGAPVMEDVREPLVDIFDEDERLLIVAEMPGVEPEDLKVDLSGTTLTLSAERGQHKYHKSIDVPAGMQRDQIAVSCRNGIIEVSCPKQSGQPEGGHG